MTEGLRYTASEMLAILSARQLKDGQVVFAGVGVPLLAATLAQRLRCPGPHHPLRGRRHRRLRRARQAAALDQRPTLHETRQYGARQRGSPAAVAARLCRRRLHGRRADRPVRQPQLLLHRRSRSAEDAPAGHGRRQRHLQPHQHDRRDEAREAALRGACRFRHQPRTSCAAARRAPKAASSRAACSA